MIARAALCALVAATAAGHALAGTGHGIAVKTGIAVLAAPASRDVAPDPATATAGARSDAPAAVTIRVPAASLTTRAHRRDFAPDRRMLAMPSRGERADRG